MSTPSELSRLLAAERAVRAPALAEERGLSRLLSELAAPALVPAAAGAVKVGWPIAAKWILTGFVVGIAGSGAAAKVWSAPAQPAALVVTAPAPVDVPSSVSLPASPPAAPSGVSSAPHGAPARLEPAGRATAPASSV